MLRAALAVLVTIVALNAIASAQIGGKPVTGNPTPGTAQPDPPNLADRVTFVGCLQPVTRRADPSADANTPSNARFELTGVARVDRVPAGTGGSPAAASASSKTYRLEGIDSQFSPFVGAKVEISGELTPSSAAEKTAPPTLLVEFVQRIAATCS
jgi:hypothetical protein